MGMHKEWFALPLVKGRMPGPKARKVIARDERHTSRHYSRYVPLVVDHASGATITDVDGNRFLDFTAGIAVVNCGHCHPDVTRAMQEQCEKLVHMCSGDYYNEPCAELSERLCGLFPKGGFSVRPKCFLTNSGTEAVEGAIKLCRYVTRRPRLVAFMGSFHGRTMGSLSLTASKYLQREGFGTALAGVEHCPYGDADYLDSMFRKTTPPDDVAAIFVEPLQGEGGYVPAPQGFLKRLRRTCDAHGIMLVADEIQSGFGRTGKWWAIDHDGVCPDVICCAKGIANGMPLGAVIAGGGMLDKWPSGAHGSTFAGNSVACAAAIASIELIKKQYMRNADAVGFVMANMLEAIRLAHPMMVREVRGRGMMLGIEFQAAGRLSASLRDAIVLDAFKRGLILLGCGEATIRLCPPLCLSQDQAMAGCEILGECVARQIKAGAGAI